ncbi:hypothetical protein N7444_003562 [Penicillium canescens]|nr:hypothetical protein N7444_003562 [Penicillium canescens]
MEPKKGLLDLPMELLSGLADFLTESDVNSLSQGSRQLYDSLNRSLYWNNARYFGSSALIRASLLLDTGRVDTEAINLMGETPLYSAAKNGQVAVVQLFLDRGVDLGAILDGGLTLGQALVDIARRGGHEEVVKLILKS